ncbi:MAG: hypothetical protein F4X36_09910 [Gammaproteobacteria bacterium]|nr:hypothetical protein [Gammaproteobacteria bacterium]
MPRIQLPAPCHLCGQTCVSSRRARVMRRLDRADLGSPAQRPDADTCPWRQCPHRRSGHPIPPVLEDQRSFGVVASTWPPTDRAPVVLSLHAVRAAAETDRDVLALQVPIPRPRGVARTDYDVVEFPHALIAAQLAAIQEEGFEYGYEHAMETACERLREDGRLPAATAALHHFAEEHPRLFADTIRYLFGVGHDIAAAVTESVRLGYALDAPLDAALSALAAAAPAEDTP